MSWVKGYWRETANESAKDKMTAQLQSYVVGELLATELSAVLPRYVEQDRLSQFPEDMQTRVREGG